MQVLTKKRSRARGYRSPVRAEHVEQTRRRILDAVSRVVAQKGVDALTLPQVARAAEVGAQTVYRHFPTKEALYEAFWRTARERFRLPSHADAESLIADAPRVFAGFDDDEALCRAFVRSRAGHKLLRTDRRRTPERGPARDIDRAIGAELSSLRSDERTRVRALFESLYSVAFWMELRDAGGFDGREAGRTVEWALKVLLAEARRRGRAGAR